VSAIDKTKALKRLVVPVDQLEPNPNNPNKMKPSEFNLLVDNLQRTGLTDAILVRRLGKDRYRIVGGHHRWEAARYLEFSEVPICVIDDPDFDDDAETFQVVRMNVIHGRMDPTAFTALYEQMSGKYTEEMLQDLFGFAEEAELRKLIKSTAKGLPPEMKQAFQEASGEIKTIDDLAKLLNRLFTTHGDSLPYNYLFLDHGGKESIWLRINKSTLDACFLIGNICRDRKRTMDDLVGFVLQSIAKGEQNDLLDMAQKVTKEVVIPAGMPVLPTKDNIKAVMSI
jgi:hypothetical protein